MANSKSKSPLSTSSVTVSKPFKPVPSPFGHGIDEQATIEAFKEYVGGNSRLESLWRISRSSHPTPKFRGGQYTQREVFRSRAIHEGFTENEIDGYLTFGN